jgi:hypothetical protein
LSIKNPQQNATTTKILSTAGHHGKSEIISNPVLRPTMRGNNYVQMVTDNTEVLANGG